MEILCKPEIPTRHISYHIHVHLQSFTRMWKICLGLGLGLVNFIFLSEF